MNNASATPQYRYPGVTPFSVDQHALFFGREEDRNNLLQLINREQITVLHGKSGLGKSSLINAGLIPAVLAQETHHPILIRFGNATAGQSSDLVGKVTTPLKAQVKQHTFLTDVFSDDESIWFHAKKMQLAQQSAPLLLFDQFEEVFTYSDAQLIDFEQSLAELLYTNLPLRFQRILDTLEDNRELTDAEEDALEEPLDAHIVFIVRSDRLHLLDRLNNYFPKILNNCYPLKALDLEGARNAIERPASLSGNFITPPFKFTEPAISEILQFLLDEEEQTVEGILIQMLCEHYEKELVEKQGLRVIELKHLGNIEAVLENHYEEKISTLPQVGQSAARHLIENGLVSENKELRLILHEAYIQSEYGVKEQLLKQLVNSRLLRSEPFARGGYNYELAHDRLIPAVIKSRNKRQAQEAEKRRDEEAQLLKQQAAKERQEKEAATKRLRTVRIALGVSVAALLLAGYLGIYAYNKKLLAEEALDKAESKTEEAIQQRKEADRQKEKAQGLLFNKYEDQLSGFIGSSSRLPEGLLSQMQEIANSHPDSVSLQARIDKLLKLLSPSQL